jgi:4'-phosphopantetheinyl transferase
MTIYWLEQTASDLPFHNEWLSSNEILRLNAMRFPKRRADWRLGRWTAKNAVASYFRQSNQTVPLTQIEIRSAPSGAPQVFFDDHPADITISLSHRDGMAACSLVRGDILLGCDLEIVEPHSNAFLIDYFTDEEQALFARADNTNLLSSLLWSAKESALKALHVGLRLDTRSVVVRLGEQCSAGVPSAPVPGESNWAQLEVHHEDGRILNGWWQHAGKLIRTLVSDPASPLPIYLVPTPSMERTTQASRRESAAVFPA